jgi:hypothetical protein
MPSRNRTAYRRLACAAGLSLIFGAGLILAHPDTLDGEAFGALINTNTTSVVKGPLAALPPDGGMAAVESADLTVANILSTDMLRAITTGAIGQVWSATQSLSTVEDVNILDGLITAKLVVPISSSTSDGFSASSNAAGSTIVDLVVGGVPVAPNIAPNTTMALPGVGYVVLNEQVGSGDGQGNSSLTVNMIHVVLQDVLTGAKTGDIVVGSATSGVVTTGVVPAHVFPSGPCVFYTGGGRLDADPALSRQDFATFGFNATTRNSPEGCGPRGQLQYIDHYDKLNIHGTSADIFEDDGFCVRFAGEARVKRGGEDLGTFPYRVTACDIAEPGVGIDRFGLAIDGFYDSANGAGSPTECPTCGRKHPILTGGNIQRHTH